MLGKQGSLIDRCVSNNMTATNTIQSQKTTSMQLPQQPQPPKYIKASELDRPQSLSSGIKKAIFGCFRHGQRKQPVALPHAPRHTLNLVADCMRLKNS